MWTEDGARGKKGNNNDFQGWERPHRSNSVLASPEAHSESHVLSRTARALKLPFLRLLFVVHRFGQHRPRIDAREQRASTMFDSSSASSSRPVRNYGAVELNRPPTSFLRSARARPPTPRRSKKRLACYALLPLSLLFVVYSAFRPNLFLQLESNATCDGCLALLVPFKALAEAGDGPFVAVFTGICRILVRTHSVAETRNHSELTRIAYDRDKTQTSAPVQSEVKHRYSLTTSVRSPPSRQTQRNYGAPPSSAPVPSSRSIRTMSHSSRPSTHPR